MSDDYEDNPYEDDEPRQAPVVEYLPPLKKWDPPKWAIGLFAFAILEAGYVANHVADRLSGTASAGVPQAMVTDNLPVSHNVEDRRSAAEEPPQARYARSEPEQPRPRWYGGITPHDDDEEGAPCETGGHHAWGAWGPCKFTEAEREDLRRYRYRSRDGW